MELTQEQIDQQDQIDNAIHDFLGDTFANHGTTPWDIEDIAEIRDALLNIAERRGIQPGDLYPGIDIDINKNSSMIQLNVPTEGWSATPRDFDPGAKVVMWEQPIITIGEVRCYIHVMLAAFKQGYRILANRVVETNAAMWRSTVGTIPSNLQLACEDIPMGSYLVNDPHGRLIGPELTEEELHALVEAHKPKAFAVRHENGTYFTLSGVTGATFEDEFGLRTVRYGTWAKAQDVVRGLVNQWHPTQASAFEVPALTEQEERELAKLKAEWSKPRKRTTKQKVRRN